MCTSTHNDMARAAERRRETGSKSVKGGEGVLAGEKKIRGGLDTLVILLKDKAYIKFVISISTNSQEKLL